MTGTTITAQPGTPFIEVVREFDAPPALLFRASTDPELVAQWLGPREVEIRVFEHDARPGGRYRYVHVDREGEHYFNGVFHTVVPDETIVRTFEYEGWPGNVSLESSTFESLDGGRTRLSMRSVYPTVEARDSMVESGMEHGIRDSMDRLAALVGPARGQVVVDISLSLDGYVTGPDANEQQGLGVGGDDLHLWAMGERANERDKEVLDASYARSGAVIMGRRLFDIIDGPNGWNDEVGYGAERDQSDAPPVVVLTHSVPEKVRLSRRFIFVTDGLESALEQAHAVAGGKDVVIMGGGETCGAFLDAGLVDELVLHVAPVVLGGGTRLFPDGTHLRLDRVGSVSTPAAEHLTYRVRRSS